MSHRQPYLGVGRALAVIIGGGSVVFIEALGIHSIGRPRSLSSFGVDLALGAVVVYLSLMAAVLIHELGHHLAARLLHVPVTSIQIGTPPVLASFSRGGTRVDLGLIPNGRVTWDRPPPPGRGWIVTLAGPLANLVTAPLPLALPLHAPIRYAAALIFAVLGLANLMPYRRAPGVTSDGQTLLSYRARAKAEREMQLLLQDPGWASRPEAPDIVLRGCRADVPTALARRLAVPHQLGQAGRIRDLLWLHQLPLSLPDSPDPGLVSAVHHLEWHVATVPDLPLADANLAGWRLDWVLKHVAAKDRFATQHTLAVVRLRQGLYGEVEPLCAEALATELQAPERASVLATVAMARHASGHSGHDFMSEALSLDPGAELVAEAVRRINQHASTPPRGRGKSTAGRGGSHN